MQPPQGDSGERHPSLVWLMRVADTPAYSVPESTKVLLVSDDAKALFAEDAPRHGQCEHQRPRSTLAPDQRSRIAVAAWMVVQKVLDIQEATAADCTEAFDAAARLMELGCGTPGYAFVVMQHAKAHPPDMWGSMSREERREDVVKPRALVYSVATLNWVVGFVASRTLPLAKLARAVFDVLLPSFYERIPEATERACRAFMSTRAGGPEHVSVVAAYNDDEEAGEPGSMAWRVTMHETVHHAVHEAVQHAIPDMLTIRGGTNGEPLDEHDAFVVQLYATRRDPWHFSDPRALASAFFAAPDSTYKGAADELWFYARNACRELHCTWWRTMADFMVQKSDALRLYADLEIAAGIKERRKPVRSPLPCFLKGAQIPAWGQFFAEKLLLHRFAEAVRLRAARALPNLGTFGRFAGVHYGAAPRYSAEDVDAALKGEGAPSACFSPQHAGPQFFSHVTWLSCPADIARRLRRAPAPRSYPLWTRATHDALYRASPALCSEWNKAQRSSVKDGHYEPDDPALVASFQQEVLTYLHAATAGKHDDAPE